MKSYLFLLGLVLFLTSCDNDGSTAGQKLDSLGNKIEQKAEQIGDSVEEKYKDVRDDVKDRVNNRDSLRDARDSARRDTTKR